MQILAQSAHMVDDRGMRARLADRCRAADAPHQQRAHMNTHKISVAKNGPDPRLPPFRRYLHQDRIAFLPHSVSLEPLDCGAQLATVLDEPHASTRCTRIKLQVTWKIRPRLQFSAPDNNIRLWERQFQLLEQRDKLRFALKLRDSRKIGNRNRDQLR